jgi:hypothetical protein
MMFQIFIDWFGGLYQEWVSEPINALKLILICDTPICIY